MWGARCGKVFDSSYLKGCRSAERHILEVCDDGFQVWTVYDRQPVKRNTAQPEYLQLNWWLEKAHMPHYSVINKMNSRGFVIFFVMLLIVPDCKEKITVYTM